MPIPEQLDAAIDRHFAGHVALLQELVRQPSVLGNERSAQEVLRCHLRGMGLSAELWDVDAARLRGHPAYAPGPALPYAGRPNLSAVLPGQGSGQSLCLSGHIDVVSPEPVEWWSTGPWSGEIREGRLYGRGALDMKGGLVMALLALRAVRDANVRLRGTVHFESTIEEECTGNGTLAARLRMGPVDGAIIPEPMASPPRNSTSEFPGNPGAGACVGEMGVIWFRLRVSGRPGYPGRSGPVNAIVKAASLVPHLHTLEDRINREFRHPAYAEIERPSRLNVGVIAAGDWPSNVPLECNLTCRLSFPPGVAVAAVKQMLAETLGRAAAADPWFAERPPAVSYPGFQAEGSVLDAQSPLRRVLGECYAAVTRESMPARVFPGTADARYFNLYGFGQALYFGPQGSDIHSPDEWVDLDSIREGARVLARFIVEWCG
ncbi:MAG: ArgE/DapE family deacylase [Armatimonadetes bacterium]|nr:ArgE/DapE family deacylase [Armatimonadota bacterium]